MLDVEKKNPYHGLETRTFMFAKRVNAYVKQLPSMVINWENGKQLVRSAGSVGANYREGNEATGKRDCVYRFRIAKKEAKESQYWLRLTDIEGRPELLSEQTDLIEEAGELTAILGSIIEKCK